MNQEPANEVVFIKHKTKPHLVADKIKEDISNKILNDNLPGYRTLMKRYSVSQTTAKEAINLLEAEGIIGNAAKGVPRRILVASLPAKLKRSLLILLPKGQIPMADRTNTVEAFTRIWKSYEGDVFECEVDLLQKDPNKKLKNLRKKYSPDALVSFILPEHWNEAILSSRLPFFQINPLITP
jgi:DNA-binding transcriptional MocR family regulator